MSDSVDAVVNETNDGSAKFKGVTVGAAVAALVAATVVIWGSSFPALPIYSLLAAVVLLGLGLACAAGLVWSLIRRRRSSRRRHQSLFWLLGVVLVVPATLALAASAIPVTTRFRLSEAAFDSYVERCEGNVRDSECRQPGSIGSFPITLVLERDGLLVLYVDSYSFSDGGFVFSPSGTVPRASSDFESPAYRELTSGWYAFSASF